VLTGLIRQLNGQFVALNYAELVLPLNRLGQAANKQNNQQWQVLFNWLITIT